MFISLKIQIVRVVFPESPPPLRYETRDLVIGSRIDGAVLSVIFLIDSQCLFFGQYIAFRSGPWISLLYHAIGQAEFLESFPLLVAQTLW